MRAMSRRFAFLLAAATIASVASANAAQPVISTPPGTAALPNIIYVLPYAVSTAPSSTANLTYPVTETVVSIGLDGEPGPVPCNFQVEWIDWNKVRAGLSGPAAPPPGGSFEFVTQKVAVVPLFPYTLNVFSDVKAPFEGSAKIRTDCAEVTKFRVDAGFVHLETDAQGIVSTNYKAIHVLKASGNIGE